MSIVLGFDYGEKRVGVAVGNQLTGTSRALEHLSPSDPVSFWKRLDGLVQEWQPSRLLVGLPLTLDGEAQTMTRKARHFTHQLRAHCKLPVEEVDERLSSTAAEQELAHARHTGSKNRRLRKGDSDSMAAALIVQQWLDAQGMTS